MEKSDAIPDSYSGVVSVSNSVTTLGEDGEATYHFTLAQAGTYDVAVKLGFPFWDKNSIHISLDGIEVDFSENRTVLFSTHVVEDLAATCNQLAIMHKGRFLYAGSMKNLTEEAQGKIWICKVPDERKAREVEQKYRITSKQYVEGGLQLRVISEIQPELECMSIPATLEDAYIYVTNQYE